MKTHSFDNLSHLTTCMVLLQKESGNKQVMYIYGFHDRL